MMNNISYIYALQEPATGLIRYIGKTNRQNIKQRYNEHLSHAKKYNENYSVSNWIRKLLKDNLNPKMNILIQTTSEYSDLLEIELIKHYNRFCNLTNMACGKGSAGTKWTIERRKKMTDNGCFEKIRQRMLGKNNPMKNPIIAKKVGLIQTINGSYEIKKQKILNDINWGKWATKPIIQYDLQGNFIREWNSIKNAEITLKIHSSGIIQCCKNSKMYKQSGGFIWKYKQINNF